MKRSNPPPGAARGRQRGYSLLELAVVVVVIGLIGLVFWQLLPSAARLPVAGRLITSPLAAASDAVRGFAQAHGRLPCPDTSGDGFENCTDEARIGLLPVRSLGLSLRVPLRYGVYRQAAEAAADDADLTVARNRFEPRLPEGVSGRINGLDLCRGLANIVRNPADALTVGAIRVPVAYAIAAPGATDADGDGNRFDGLNSVDGRFAEPDTGSAGYDDSVIAVGAAELHARLGCPQRMGAVHAAARTAFADYDADRFAAMYLRFRIFAKGVREMNFDLAVAAEVMAAADLVIATAGAATAVALAAVSGGSASGAVAAGAAAIGAATVALAAATASLIIAQNAVEKAEEQRVAAVNYRNWAAGQYAASLARAREEDLRGLRQ